MTKHVEQPYATVERVGRWIYAVFIKDGTRKSTDPWRVWGYHRAVRKGKRELKKYVKRKALKIVEKVTLD